MTEAALVQLIMTLCSPRHTSQDREKTIACFERLTNCAVKGDKILSYKEFDNRCLDEDK